MTGGEGLGDDQCRERRDRQQRRDTLDAPVPDHLMEIEHKGNDFAIKKWAPFPAY